MSIGYLNTDPYSLLKDTSYYSWYPFQHFSSSCPPAFLINGSLSGLLPCLSSYLFVSMPTSLINSSTSFKCRNSWNRDQLELLALIASSRGELNNVASLSCDVLLLVLRGDWIVMLLLLLRFRDWLSFFDFVTGWLFDFLKNF